MPTDTAYSSAILLGGCRMPLVSVEFSHCVNCMQGIIFEGGGGGEELASADSGTGRVAVRGGRLPRPWACRRPLGLLLPTATPLIVQHLLGL